MKIKNHKLKILLVILCLPAIWPLLHSGLFVSDDATWMVIRLSDFHRSFVDGQWPVRWAGRLNNGYGYPVFNFLYPGIMYLGEILHLIFRLNFLNSVKALFGLSLFFSGIFSFLWLRNYFGKLAGLVGALAYVYFPYHLYLIYTRGSLGEAIALVFYPLILYFTDKKQTLVTTLFLSLLIISHNTLAFLFIPVFIAYLFVNNQKVFAIKTLILSLLLTTWFWLPAIYDQQYTIFGLVNISKPFEHFITSKNYELVIYSIILIIFSSHFVVKSGKIVRFWFFILFLSLFLSTSLSNILWKLSPINNLLQFPFRFMAINVLASAFLLANLTTKNKIWTLLLIILITFSFKQWPKQYEEYTVEYYATNEATTNTQNEYLPIWTKNTTLTRVQNKVEILSGIGKVSINKQKSNAIEAQIYCTRECQLRINTVFFPGWKAYLNNKNIPVDVDNNGLILIKTTQGEQNLKVQFTETPLRLFSDIISVLTVVLVIIYEIKKRYF